MNEYTDLCPWCEEEICLPVEKFDTVANCPHCGEPIGITFNPAIQGDHEGLLAEPNYDFTKLQDSDV
jgi:hypothetical protein